MGLGDRLEDFDILIRLRTSVGLGHTARDTTPVMPTRDLRHDAAVGQTRTAPAPLNPAHDQASPRNLTAGGRPRSPSSGRTARDSSLGAP